MGLSLMAAVAPRGLLRADVGTRLPFLRRDGPDPAWLPHGDWLIGLSKMPESGKKCLVAIASNRVQARTPAQQASPPFMLPHLASFW